MNTTSTSEDNMKHYMALQWIEIDEHKWYLSEQAGYDVGGDATIEDWLSSGHAERFNKAYKEHLDELEALATRYSRVPNSLLHRVLDD